MTNNCQLCPFTILIESLTAALGNKIQQTLSNIQLQKFVYKSIPNLNNATSCGAFCLFDHLECNFYYTQNGDCYFGNLHCNNSNQSSITNDEEVTILGSKNNQMYLITLFKNLFHKTLIFELSSYNQNLIQSYS